MPAGVPVTSSDVAARVQTATLTADSPGYSTEVAIFTVTAFLEAGRRYAVQGIARVSISAGTFPAAETALLRLREDSVAGTQLTLTQFPILNTSANGFGSPPLYGEYTATVSGTKTFALTAQRNGGSATHTVRAATNAPAFLFVDLLRT